MTIEELAREYAEYMCPAEDYACLGDMERDFDMSVCFNDAKSLLKWLFDKPLAQRCTEEEKERVREMYVSGMDICIAGKTNNQEVMERIFGKELFKEDKL